MAISRTHSKDSRASGRAFDFDISCWPVVMVVLHGTQSEDDYLALFAEWERVFQRKERYAAITDARAVKERASPKQRAVIADWIKRVDPKLAVTSVGHAVVIESAFVRGAMTAIQWLHKASVPEAYFSTVREAVDFATDRLTEQSVPLSPALRAFRSSL